MADVRATSRLVSVAVPRALYDLNPQTGAGRAWRSVLPHLRKGARVGPARWITLRRPDVWLLPAHGHPVKRREPVVAVIHGAGWLLEPEMLELMPRAFAQPFAAATSATLARAAVAIVPSQYTRRALTEGLGMPEERVAVVPHGVDTAVFNPSAGGGRAHVAEALGEDRPYVLFASIPSIPQKNLAALRSAAAELAGRGHPHALVIAGGLAGGETDAEVAAIEADLPGFPDRVAWLGHVEDDALAGLMADADAFCLPSLYEAFGLTALEALACGTPVVASSRGALPEVVGDAALVSQPTPEALADALERVLADRDLAGRLRAAGPARAAGMSWARTATGWLDAIRRAVEAG